MNNVIRNITGTTAVVLGLTFSAVGNSSIVVEGNNFTMQNYKIYSDIPDFSHNTRSLEHIDNNIYITEKRSSIEKIASETFGVMRDATKEETESVNRYINTISKETGVDFFSC